MALRIGLALQPLSKHNLKLAAQIGATDVVYYDMTTMPMTVASLRGVRTQAHDVGLEMTVIEGGPPKDSIVLGRPDRDAEIEAYKRAVEAMGQAGFDVLCYDWMPSHVEVIRTSRSHPERGGAITTSFSPNLWEDTPAPEAPIDDDTMWRNLEYFLERIIPVAESAGVRLAMHPDDPPLSPICGIRPCISGFARYCRTTNVAALPDGPGHSAGSPLTTWMRTIPTASRSRAWTRSDPAMSSYTQATPSAVGPHGESS